MGLEFLRRVRRSTLWLGLLAALTVTTYAGVRPGLGLALGIVWSLVNLALLERLVVAITSPDRGTRPALRRASLAFGGMLALFGAGGMLLTALPPMWLLGGFLVPFAVLVLKAASLLLLESAAWRWVTASPWRATLVVATFVVAAWWVVPGSLQPAPAANAAVSRHAAAPPQADHVAGEAPARSEAGSGEDSGPQKFPNFITVIARGNPHAGWAHLMHENEAVIFAWIVGLLLIAAAFFATRNPQMIPGPLQNLVEMLVEFLYNFIEGIIGDRHAARFVPFLGTLGIYIWAMNLFGLIPFMDSPTSSLNVTFSLAIVVFLYVQYVGIRGLGLGGYVDHLMGQPRNLTGWLLVPLMLPIHLLGELAKPISLSCRLFGNIFGEDMLLVAFVSLGVTTLAWSHLPFGLPLQLPFLLLALLTSTLQALVFMVLSTIYILLMLPHDHGHHEGDAHPAH